MQELFSSPGMIAALVVVLLLEGLSLLLLFINIEVFRGQSNKYRLFLANLGDESAWGRPGRILIPVYVLCTLAVTMITTMIFLFQPHVL